MFGTHAAVAAAHRQAIAALFTRRAGF